MQEKINRTLVTEAKRMAVYHKIGRIPPFLVGGGMNATITIHRQM